MVTRAYIQASSHGIHELADELGISVSTVHHWRGRDDAHDRSHTRKNLLASLSEALGGDCVELRRTLRRPLDDLLAVKAKPFKAYEPEYTNIDYKYLPQMPDGSGRRYLYVAINRATRCVYVEIKAHQDTLSAMAFLEALRARAPFRIRRLLTDNDKAFTDRFHNKSRRPDQRGARHPALQFPKRSGADDQALQPSVQSPHPAESAGATNAQSGHKGPATEPPSAIHKGDRLADPPNVAPAH